MERKTSRKISRKIRGPRKPQASSIKESKAKEKIADDTAVYPRQKPRMGSRPGSMVVR